MSKKCIATVAGVSSAIFNKHFDKIEVARTFIKAELRDWIDPDKAEKVQQLDKHTWILSGDSGTSACGFITINK